MNTNSLQFENSQEYLNIKAKLLDYLSQRDYSEARLVEKVCSLKKRYPNNKRYRLYTPRNVKRVIKRLKEVDIINEQRFLENMLFTSLQSQYGLRRIIQKMYRQKYNKKHIEAVLERFCKDAPKRDFTTIQRLAQQRKEMLVRKYPHESLHDINNRLFQFLTQKGFFFDEIKQIIAMLQD